MLSGVFRKDKYHRRACNGLPTRSETLDKRFHEENKMNTRHHTKLVHEGQYAAEVDVELIETENDWSPYLSLDEAYKLDDVRMALRHGDVQRASRLARVFSLTPVLA